MSIHEKFMREALALARKGCGWSSPNPMVGALVVKAGKVVGRGWHPYYGGPHAEVVALFNAGRKAQGATLYVTLEPCAHRGKTPPCVDAIREAGVKTVVLGARDPNPLAAGGVELLRRGKVKVVLEELEPVCRRANAPFFKHVRTGLPFVTAKWAMTLDGKIATAQGDSQWITAPRARAFAHSLRGQHDAVLVGIGTVLHDAPLLTCRFGLLGPAEHVWQPRRVVLDSQARMPLDAPLWTAPNGGPILIVVSAEAPLERVQALQDKGAEIINLVPEGGRPPVQKALDALAKRGVTSLLVEGGAEVLGSFLDARLVDRAYVFVAPKIAGGRGALSAVAGQGVERIRDASELRAMYVRKLGPDLLLAGRLGDWAWLEPAGKKLRTKAGKR